MKELLENILAELRNISDKLDDIDDDIEGLTEIEEHLDDIKSMLGEKFGIESKRKDFCGPGEHRRKNGTIG